MLTFDANYLELESDIQKLRSIVSVTNLWTNTTTLPPEISEDWPNYTHLAQSKKSQSKLGDYRSGSRESYTGYVVVIVIVIVRFMDERGKVRRSFVVWCAVPDDRNPPLCGISQARCSGASSVTRP